MTNWELAEKINRLSLGHPGEEDIGQQHKEAVLITNTGMARQGTLIPDLCLGVEDGEHFSDNPRPEYAGMVCGQPSEEGPPGEGRASSGDDQDEGAWGAAVPVAGETKRGMETEETKQLAEEKTEEVHSGVVLGDGSSEREAALGEESGQGTSGVLVWADGDGGDGFAVLDEGGATEWDEGEEVSIGWGEDSESSGSADVEVVTVDGGDIEEDSGSVEAVTIDWGDIDGDEDWGEEEVDALMGRQVGKKEANVTLFPGDVALPSDGAAEDDQDRAMPVTPPDFV